MSTRQRQRLGLLLGLPVALVGWGVLKVLHRVRGPSTTGVAGWLQRHVFLALARRHEEAVVQVPVMFPGEVCAWPVEAGIVEPVLALWAQGVQTEGACQGHRDTFAHIGLAHGHKFPAQMLEWLERSQVAYDLQRHPTTGTAVVYPRRPEDNERFCAELTAWARASAEGVPRD